MAKEDKKDKQEKKDKNRDSSGRCIEPPMPANAPEGSYFDPVDCVWKDSGGNPIGGG